MKSIFVFLLLFSCNTLLAQTILSGRVVLQNTGGKPVAGAEVSASIWAASKITDAEGRFVLQIQSKKPGDQITLQVQKPGLEVVNAKELSLKLPSSPGDSVKIVMCPVGQRDKNMLIYFEINEKSITQRYEQELAKLRKEANTPAEAFEALRQQFEVALAQTRELSEKFADVNIDDESDLYRQAFAHFEKGDIAKALELLSQANIPDKIRQQMEEEQKLTELKKQVEERNQRLAAIKKQNLEVLLTKADFYVTKGQFDSAELCYELAVKADSTNWDYVYKLAVFLQEQKHSTKSDFWYQKALTLADMDEKKALVFNNLGALYKNENNFLQAKEAYLRALQIREQLTKDNPKLYLPELASTLNNLGSLYQLENEYSKAKEFYLMALQIREHLAKEQAELYLPDLARTLNNLGVLYESENNYPEAKETYLRALQIIEQLAKERPKIYLPDLAGTLNNLGSLYQSENEYLRAQEAYIRSLQIREQLANEHPKLYLPDLARTFHNLGVLYQLENDYTKTKEAYLRALQIREQLAKDQPKLYLPDLASTLNNLGNLYESENSYAKAKEAYLRALQIIEQLAKEQPKVYLPDLARTFHNLGLLYYHEKAYGKAEETLIKALKIREQLAKEQPKAFLPELAQIHYNLGALYKSENDYPKAREAYLRALTIYEQLAKEQPRVYLPDLASTIYNLGILYQSENNYAQAKEAYLKALKIYEQSAKKQPEVYLPNLANTLNFIAGLYYQENDYAKSKETFAKSLQVYEQLVYSYGNQQADISDKTLRICTILKQLEPDNRSKIPWQEKTIRLLEKNCTPNCTPEQKKELANKYGDMAWLLFFDRQFSRALEFAQKGLVTDPSQEWINTNLALGYLFTDQYQKAQQIYIALKDKPYDKGTYKDVFLSDLDELEKAGITHPDIPKIRALLAH